MKIHPGLIGFDIDGVVADTAEAFIRIARDDYGINTISLADITEFEVENCLDLEPSIVNDIFARILAAPLASGLKPMPHAVPVLNELARLAPLTFVTARPHGRPVADWLQSFLEPDAFEKTRLVAMGEHDRKASYIKELGLKFFVDDRAMTCINLCREGLSPIVYNQPWNRGRHNLPMVDNWLEIRALCLV